MANIEEIVKEITAHGQWKARLAEAINTGKIDVPVETICQDDQCAFGKWLYGATLAPSDKTSSHYRTVKDLHAEFHKTAARVAELASSGKKAEAERMMDLGGEYAAISGRLTIAMMEWKKVSS